METFIATLAQCLSRRDDVETTLFVVADNTRPRNASSNTRTWPNRLGRLNLDVHVDRYRVIRRQVSRCVDIPNRKLRRWERNLWWQIPTLALTWPFRPRDPSPQNLDPRMLNNQMDVWICFGDGIESHRAIRTANHSNVPIALWLQSNAGLTDAAFSASDYVNHVGESARHQHACVTNADQVICQTRWQQDRISERFNRTSVVIANGIETAHWRPGQQKAECTEVLWVGRADDFHKHPLKILEVARRCPGISFRMILNPFDDAIEAKVRSQCPSNVRIIDRVSFNDMPTQFANASAFVSTGSPESEGFPNVLLQAAATHTPIVSLVDFNDFLSQSGAGVACDDSLEKMAEAVQKQATDPSIDWPRVDAYLKRNHCPEVLGDTLIQNLIELIQRERKQ